MCAKIQQQLGAWGNDPVTTFHYQFLSENAKILSIEGGVGLNFNDHSEALYQTELSCRTTILDFDKAEQIECKTGGVWDSSHGKYESNFALLLCCTHNRSGMLPPGIGDLIFSATVVWKCTMLTTLKAQLRYLVPFQCLTPARTACWLWCRHGWMPAWPAYNFSVCRCRHIVSTCHLNVTCRRQAKLNIPHIYSVGKFHTYIHASGLGEILHTHNSLRN